MLIRRTILPILLAAGAAIAAEPPYAGRWKMNPEKSNLAGTTVTYTQLPSGEMQFSGEGVTFRFKIDGNDYPDGMGDTGAWTSTGDKSWQTVWKLNGKTLSTDAVTLSDDGNTLIIQTTGTKPNGEQINDTSTYHRVSGGPGLAGKWKSETYKSASPNTLEFTPSGENGLVFKMVEMDLTCESKLDGKDYPCSGPSLGPGWSIMLTKSGGRTLNMTVNKDGKPFYKYIFTTAADGKTMTETGGPTATKEKTKIILEKQ